jgi:hypothetical protein
VVVLQLAVALAHHDTEFLSQAALPTSNAALPAGMDPTLGRVIAIDDHVPVRDAYRYFMYAYGTYFEVPSLGGYNPLVSRRRLEFSLGLDVPNVFVKTITPEVRAQLEARAVRYWIVDPDSPRRAEVEKLDGVKLLGVGGETDYLAPSGLNPMMAKTQGVALGYLISPFQGSRANAATPTTSSSPLIYEDTRAEPMAFDAAAPLVALPLRYAGNSMLIQLDHDSLVAVSAGPTDGWWYRVDGGDWQKPDYRDDHLFIRVSSDNRQLEVRYRDPWLRLVWRKLFRPSIIAIPIIALVTFGQQWLRARRQRAGPLTFGSSKTF